MTNKKCNFICDRFLRNIRKWYGKDGTKWAKIRVGAKNTYDDRFYDCRVLKTLGEHHYNNKEDYRRCSTCGIILLKSVFSICPCCDNTRLTLKYRKGGRN